MSNSIPSIKIRPERVLLILLAITILLVAFGVWGQYIRYFPERINVHGKWDEFGMNLLSQEFNLNAEENIPTYFKSFLLLAAAVLFAIIASYKNSLKDKFRLQWTLLALLYLYFSIDDAAVLHERLIQPMRTTFHPGGWFYFAWVIPALIGLAVLGLAYLTFFLHLENRFKLLFIISVAIYFGGAVGMEMVGGRFASSMGQRNFTFAMYSAIEESMQITGSILLVYTLIKYIETYLPQLQILTSHD
jgi:hypothetical protein